MSTSSTRTKQKKGIEKKRKTPSSWDSHMQLQLKDPQYAQTYLEVALEDLLSEGDMRGFLLALQQLAKAKGGIAQLAAQSGLTRESLYKTLSSTGNPKFQTVLSIIHALGMRLRCEAV